MYLLLLAACIRTPCGKGTHTADGSCVPDADADTDILGPLSGTHTASEADASWDGGGRVGGVGESLVGGVELTGDRYSDLVIGVPGAIGDANYSGAVYIVPGVAT